MIEFAWSLPLHLKTRDGKGKWILRQLLHKYVPRELFERPKTGFGIPIDCWLRGPLREWAGSSGISRRQELFRCGSIRRNGPNTCRARATGVISCGMC